jgi:putative ABC transport system ATP-binding protein
MTAGSAERESRAHTIAKPSIVVECTGVGRTFGSGRTAVNAVTDASCRVPSAARIALTGPSGSGKSTLLHVIAGLDAPTAGEVKWPGLQTNRRGYPTGIGVVFQGPSLLPSLDVTENVALPLLFAGQPEDTAMRRAGAALDLVGIGELAGKLPDELSGGQSQRVAIARVVAEGPSVILADEPTGQLDHHNGDRVITVLLDTAITLGAALIVATHDDAVAARLTDRWTMQDGRLDPHPHDEQRTT